MDGIDAFSAPVKHLALAVFWPLFIVQPFRLVMIDHNANSININQYFIFTSVHTKVMFDKQTNKQTYIPKTTKKQKNCRFFSPDNTEVELYWKFGSLFPKESQLQQSRATSILTN